MTERPKAGWPAEPTANDKGHFRRFWSLYTHILLVGCVVGMFFWKQESEVVLHEQHQSELQNTQAHGVEFSEELEENFLRMNMQTWVWLVQSEVEAGHMDDLRDHFRNFVKTYNVTSVALVDNLGNFILTTDQKLEGEQYEGPYIEVFANATEIICEYESDRGEYLVAAPVMGENTMLGYLFFLFRRDELTY